MLVRTTEHVRGMVPKGVKVGTCGMRLKAKGDMHSGHADVVRALRKKCDYIIANLWPTEGFLRALMGVRPSKDPYQPDIDYCANFLIRAGADMVFAPQADIHEELLDGCDPIELMIWAQRICLRNGYVFQDNSKYLSNLLFYMIVNRLIQEKKLFPRHVRADSTKDGLLALYRDHFNVHVMRIETILLPPTTQDGLPLSTSLKSRDDVHIELLKEIPRIFKRLDLKKSGEEIRVGVIEAVVDSAAAAAGLSIIDSSIYQNAIIGEGRSMIELRVPTQYNSTYTYWMYIDHEKGIVL